MKKQKPKDRLSVFISLVLRHNPAAAHIRLDEHGWANVDALIQGINSTGRSIDRETLEHIVATDSKGRYSFDDSHSRIRANQGHSIPVDVELQPSLPPPWLYHGTAVRFLHSIMSEGITRQSRQYVHLSADVETARQVGARHGKSIVLQVRAGEMANDNHSFFLSQNKVWLCRFIPARYITICTGGESSYET